MNWRDVLTAAGITTLPAGAGFGITPNCPTKFDNAFKFAAAAAATAADCACTFAVGSIFDKSFNDCAYCTAFSKPG